MALTMTGRPALWIGVAVAATAAFVAAIAALLLIRRALLWPEPVLESS